MSDLNPLSQNFTLKSLLKFSFPTILMMIFIGLYTVVDTIWIVNTFLDNFFKVVFPVLYRCLIS